MLSIIIPSYKSAVTLAGQLPDFINYLKNKNIVHEIIVVDDGSMDMGATAKVATDNGCIYLENKINITIH